MAALSKPYITPPRVDWSNPLTRGLVGAYQPGTMGGNAIVGPKLAVGDGGVAKRTITKDGLSYDSTTTTVNQGWIANAPASFTGNSCTIFWRGVLVGNADNFADPIGITYTTSDTTPFGVYMMLFGSGAPGNVQTFWNTAGTFTFGTGVSTTANQGSMVGLCATFLVGGNSILYINGSAQATDAFGAGAPTTSTPQFVINQYVPGQPRAPNARCNLAFVWNRQLSAVEVAQLDQSPYQFLIYPEEDMLAQLVGVVAAGPTVNYGWEIQSLQPPRPRWMRSGSLMRGDDGIQSPFTQWFNAGAEIQPFQPPRARWERRGSILKGDDGIQSPFTQWFNTGWEVQPPQPPHPRPERSGALMRGDEGIQSPFTQWFNTGWEIQPFQPPHPRPERSGALMRGVDMPDIFINWLKAGWEIQPFQPPHPRPERSGALMRGDEGIQSPFTQWFNAGWEIQPFQPPHPRPERSGAIMIGNAGIEVIYVPVIIAPPAWGWEIQPFQPPHPRPERSGALMRGDDGIQFPFINWFNTGWEIQPFQPPHRRFERSGAIMRGDDGIQAIYVPTFLLSPDWGWEIQPFQPPHPRPERSGAIMRGDEGIQGPFFQWYNTGWEILPFQPPHPRPERSGALMRGDEGTQSPFTQWFNTGWEIQPFQPPHPHPEYRAGALMRGDDGIQSTLQRWFNWGWEVQPFQPPHRGVNRYGAILIGDPGIQYPFIFVPPPLVGLRLRTLVGTGL